MHVPQTSLKPRRRRDHEACSKKVFWLWLQRLVWFFSAGGPGLPKHCNIGKTSITLSINDLCIHLFLHTKLQCFGLLTQFRNMTFPILRFFFFKILISWWMILHRWLQEAKTVAAVASPSHAPKFGRVDGCRSFPLWRANPIVWFFGEFHLLQGFWDGSFFFSAGSFVFCPDSFLIEVVKH